LRSNPEEELAILQSCTAAALAAEDVNVFDEALPKDGVEMLTPWSCVQFHLGHIVAALALREVGRWDRHELAAQSVLEGEETPLQEVKSVHELALESQEIGKI
jgi:hypothetical protein